MKILTPILFMLILSACAPKQAEPIHPRLSQTNRLTLLIENLSSISIIVDGVEQNIDIDWMTKSYAQRCQRMLDVYLEDNQIGAFLDPSDQASVVAFTEKLSRFLQENQVSESHIWNKKPEITKKYMAEPEP